MAWVEILVVVVWLSGKRFPNIPLKTSLWCRMLAEKSWQKLQMEMNGWVSSSVLSDSAWRLKWQSSLVPWIILVISQLYRKCQLLCLSSVFIPLEEFLKALSLSLCRWHSKRLNFSFPLPPPIPHVVGAQLCWLSPIDAHTVAPKPVMGK